MLFNISFLFFIFVSLLFKNLLYLLGVAEVCLLFISSMNFRFNFGFQMNKLLFSNSFDSILTLFIIKLLIFLGLDINISSLIELRVSSFALLLLNLLLPLLNKRF